MNILEEFNKRGLVKDVSNAQVLQDLLSRPQTIYCGFDPSASSMHLGNFLMIMVLMRLQKAGHRVIAVVGGGTGMIGDPSGKNKERRLLTEVEIEENTQLIKNQLQRFIDLSNPNKGLLVNNYDWLRKINLLAYLRDYGKHFPINYMLDKELVAQRLTTGISYTEFSYMILQAIDFLTLYQNYGCTIQIGGSDQWGNLTAGLEIIRKTTEQETPLAVFTTPLITNVDGSKFGKSEQGAMYLDNKMTSSYQLYQYLINVGDNEASDFLKKLTFLSLDEIEDISNKHKKAPHLRLAQKELAKAVVSIIHGQEDAFEAIKMSDVLFTGDIKGLSKGQLHELFGSLTIKVNQSLPLVDAIVLINAAKSKREAREFINGNSIMINGQPVTDENYIIDKGQALFNEYTLVRRGKKNYYLIHHI
jgi:tyrosyl-tRNA synthetase